MPATRSSAAKKRERSIPVKVTIDPRPAPTSLPPVVPTAPTPAPRPSKKKPQPIITPKKKVSPSIDHWSEEKRRKLMWWIVIGGAGVVIAGWLAVVRIELSDQAGPNLFTDTIKLLKSIHWPSSPKPSPAEQEIRTYEQQVFPQFTQ